MKLQVVKLVANLLVRLFFFVGYLLYWLSSRATLLRLCLQVLKSLLFKIKKFAVVPLNTESRTERFAIFCFLKKEKNTILGADLV